MKVVFTEEADSDLLQITDYLIARNPGAARDLVNLFNEKLATLGHFPFIGRERSSLGVDLRSIVVDNYIVFYRPEAERILIVRILHGRRDIDAEFEH
jgi:toxin ParE1/3/4